MLFYGIRFYFMYTILIINYNSMTYLFKLLEDNETDIIAYSL